MENFSFEKEVQYYTSKNTLKNVYVVIYYAGKIGDILDPKCELKFKNPENHINSGVEQVIQLEISGELLEILQSDFLSFDFMQKYLYYLSKSEKK